jgi:hypothetical protein
MLWKFILAHFRSFKIIIQSYQILRPLNGRYKRSPLERMHVARGLLKEKVFNCY